MTAANSAFKKKFINLKFLKFCTSTKSNIIPARIDNSERKSRMLAAENHKNFVYSCFSQYDVACKTKNIVSES